MAKKILVTGAGGYIGSVASYLFLQNGLEVVAVDNFSTGYEEPLKLLEEKFGPKQLRYYRQDLKSPIDNIFSQEKGVEAVVHYAAHCSVDESMRDPVKYFANNVGGTIQLLQSMIRANVEKIVFSSTCAVYGEAESVPVDETHPTRPANPYGESKLMAERVLSWLERQTKLRYFILRYFNVCGAADDGIIGDSKKPSQLLMQNAVRGALGLEPFYLTCPTVGTPDGTPIRDYINVVDLGEAHLAALEYLDNGGDSETVNLGTGTGNSVLEVIKSIEELTGHRFELERSTPRQGEYAKMIAATDKARRVLKWQTKRTLGDSIGSLIKWYQLHHGGWR